MLTKSLNGLSQKQRREIESKIRSLCVQIQETRIKKGFTQESFAEAIDVNVNTVKYIEQGRRIPSLPMLLRVCRTLNLKLSLTEE